MLGKHVPIMYLTYTLTCTSRCRFGDWNNLVVRPVASLRQLIAELLHRQSDVDLRTSRVRHQRILLLNQFEQLLAIHRLCHLTLLRLSDTGIQDLSNVLLLHVVLVQLLDALHLEVVEPIRCLHLSQLMEHLRIELSIVDVTLIVDQLTFWNRQTDVATRASGVTNDSIKHAC